MTPRVQSPFELASAMSARPWGSRDVALVIEDNEGIATLLGILLGKAGLKAIRCNSGQEALAQFALHRESITLVVSDCRLPDGDGREICRQMREQLPNLPLLLSSGTATCLNLGPLTSDRLVRFMPKPYAPDEMLQHVEKLRTELGSLATISAGFV